MATEDQESLGTTDSSSGFNSSSSATNVQPPQSSSSSSSHASSITIIIDTTPLHIPNIRPHKSGSTDSTSEVITDIRVTTTNDPSMTAQASDASSLSTPPPSSSSSPPSGTFALPSARSGHTPHQNPDVTTEDTTDIRSDYTSRASTTAATPSTATIMHTNRFNTESTDPVGDLERFVVFLEGGDSSVATSNSSETPATSSPDDVIQLFVTSRHDDTNQTTDVPINDSSRHLHQTSVNFPPFNLNANQNPRTTNPSPPISSPTAISDFFSSPSTGYFDLAKDDVIVSESSNVLSSNNATDVALPTTEAKSPHSHTNAPTTTSLVARASSDIYRTKVKFLTTPGSAKSLNFTRGSPPVASTTHHETPCSNNADGAVAMWLGFPVFWWVVVTGAFVLLLMMILSICVCIVTSKRKWRKKNHQRRGYLDDQLTSSFIQSYSNPEVTPSSRNNKNGKLPPKPKKGNASKSYPKSYRLGPQLLPFPADAVRLRPSVCSSAPQTPLAGANHIDPDHVINGGFTDECFNDKNFKAKHPPARSGGPENSFGTWRKSGVAVFGGIMHGYKRPNASNHLVEGGEGVGKKSRSDDDVFDEAAPGDPKDVALTTFKNNVPRAGSTSTFKS